MRTIKLTLLLAFVSMCALAQPTIKTNTRYARGATKAFGRMSLLMNGESIQESGFCWSQNSKEPTINDNKSTKKWSNNGQIVVMEGLEPATLYYARAYVTTGKGETYYGNTIKFCTVPKGSISWGYDNGGSSAENARINSAVQSCVDYWNEYTSITGLYLTVHYGSGTPTADCSYGGWMRVGPNSAYQSTGTIMHEALHAIGVGTTEMWFGASSPLRQGAGTGDWLGYNANEFVKFWDNNSSACLKGDGTHLWPYGINGAQEDNHTEALYAACSMVAQAVCEDGIACNGGYAFGMPHYSFTQEDDIKYYIKNEDETRGLSTSFLVETAANKLQWQTMTADEAAANDAAAWYVTFIPSKQVYQLRNAATGNYMTYKQSGTDGIVCEASSSQTTNNTFCLMRSRTDVTSSTGTKLTTERGYWLLNPELSNAKPYCLEASSNGSVSAMQYSNLDATKRQRWLILNADQAKAMENSGLVAARDAFDQVNVVANELPFTPHACITPDADDVYEASLAKIQANLEATTSPTEVNNLTTELRTAMMNYLANIYVTDLNNPFDLT
ncbi:MAG: hypothetical protein HUK07_04200, partial [Bacteroidaceae bacterium]|nr:hypothetical protein [Bacteroidaceae bacterium]